MDMSSCAEKTPSSISTKKPKFRGLQRLSVAYIVPFLIINLLTEEHILPVVFIVQVIVCSIALLAYCWCATYKMKRIYEKPATALVQLMIAFIAMQFAYYAERSDAKTFINKNGMTDYISNKLYLVNLQQTITVTMIVVLLLCYAREQYRTK